MTLAKEFARCKIRVNCLSLMITSDTPSWDRIISGESFQGSMFAKVIEKFPQGRAPTADEVAKVVVFFASQETSQITGNVSMTLQSPKHSLPRGVAGAPRPGYSPWTAG